MSSHSNIVVSIFRCFALMPTLILSTSQIAEAYNKLLAEDLGPRGFAFWNILDEGRVPPEGDYRFKSPLEDGSLSHSADIVSENKETEGGDNVCGQFWLARDLNSFLRIRKP
jgi:hypothetical protein